jgi:4-hydroxybenzoate polyprenyltransferase
MIDALRLLLLIVIGLFGFITYALMSSALNEKGIRPILFLTYISDLVEFIYLTKDTTDSKRKPYYRRLLWGFFISMALFIGIGLTFLVLPWNH